MSGRYTAFARRARISSQRAPDRAPTAARRGRRAPRWTASAVPQLPAPRTATRRVIAALLRAARSGARPARAPRFERCRKTISDGRRARPRATAGAGRAGQRRRSAAAPIDASTDPSEMYRVEPDARRGTPPAPAATASGARTAEHAARGRDAFAAAEPQPDRDRCGRRSPQRPAAAGAAARAVEPLGEQHARRAFADVEQRDQHAGASRPTRAARSRRRRCRCRPAADRRAPSAREQQRERHRADADRRAMMLRTARASVQCRARGSSRARAPARCRSDPATTARSDTA